MHSPPSIPDHTLIRPIGRGAYGEVWLARNIMGAPRAVKIIWRHQFESDRPYNREFAGLQRYEPVSRSSGGLVHVLHVGRNDAAGYFFYVMELADAANDDGRLSKAPSLQEPSGDPASSFAIRHSEFYSPRTLRSDLKRLARLPTADCLRLGLDVAGGIGQLHHHGLVHRDVKPGNIIYVNGCAKLADLGLVSKGGESRTFVGTEGYIPPEGPGSPGADIYALGITLFEASTGLPPDQFPDVPPEWLTGESGDDALELHEVILKACESQRERRYKSTEELQADLALLQSGQSVRRMRALERRAVRARRLGWVALVVIALAVTVSVLSGWRARVAAESRAQEKKLREAAQQSLGRAEAAELDARQKLYSAYLAQARATVQSGEVGRRFRTLEAVRQATAIRNTPELRQVALAALSRPDLRVEREIDLGGRVNAVAVDESFTRYAIARDRGAVEVRSLSDPQWRVTLPASTNLEAHLPVFSPNGGYLAVKRFHAGFGDSDLEVWNLATTQRVVLARHGVVHGSFSFHPTRPRLLAGRPSGRLVTWDLERGVETGSWRLPPHWSVAYSPAADRFAIAQGQGTNSMVEVRDAHTGAVLTGTPFPNTVLSVAWHPDGQHLLVPCSDGNVSLMDARDGTLRTLGQHKAQAVSGWITPVGDFAFSSGWDNEINVWNLRNFQHELTTALGGIELQFNRHRPQVAVLVEHRRLQILEFSGAAEGRELAGDLSFGTRSGRFSADGRWLAVPTIDGVGVWDLARAAPAATRKDAGLGGVFFLEDSDEMIGWSEDELFRWRLTPSPSDTAPPRLDPLPIFALNAGPVLRPKQYVHSAHLVARDSTLLLALGDGLRRVPLTNLATGVGQFQKAPVWRSVVSADERWLATSLPGQAVVVIYRLPDMQMERWLTNAAPVRGLAFAPQDGALAVLTDISLSLWSAADWQVKRTRPVAADSFGRVAFSSDGKTLLLTENTRVGGLLFADTLEAQLPLPAWMQPLALSADGRFLAVGVESRRVQLWDLRTVRARFRELGVDWEL